MISHGENMQIDWTVASRGCRNPMVRGKVGVSVNSNINPTKAVILKDETLS